MTVPVTLFALLASAAVAIACAALSVFVVARRWAFIGEGIAHAAQQKAEDQGGPADAWGGHGGPLVLVMKVGESGRGFTGYRSDAQAAWPAERQRGCRRS